MIIKESDTHIQIVVPIEQNGKCELSCEKDDVTCGCEYNKERAISLCKCDTPCYVTHKEGEFEPLRKRDLTPFYRGFIKQYLGSDGGVAVGFYTSKQWALKAFHFSFKRSCESKKICRDIIFSGEVKKISYINSNLEIQWQ